MPTGTMREHERLEAVQALRAIAAGLVVLVHAFRTLEYRADATVEATQGLALGDIGVKLFFVISGFIIVRSAFGLPPGAASFVDFARRRLIRVVPLYWLGTFVFAAKLSLQGQPPAAWELLCSLFFIPYVDSQGLMRPVLGLGWTLNFEMFFYATVALALLLTPRLRLAWVLAVLVTMLVLPQLGGDRPAVPGQVDWLQLSDHRLLFFVAGMLIAHLFQHEGVGRRVSIGWGTAVGLAMLLIVVDLVIEDRRMLDDAPRQLMQLLVCTAAVALAVAAASPRRDGAASRAAPAAGGAGGGLTGRLRAWVVAAGDGSYSTYLFHGFVIGPATRIAVAFGWQQHSLLFAVVMLVVCTALGVFLFRVFEAPVGRWLTRRLAPVDGARRQTPSRQSA